MYDIEFLLVSNGSTSPNIEYQVLPSQGETKYSIVSQFSDPPPNFEIGPTTARLIAMGAWSELISIPPSALQSNDDLIEAGARHNKNASHSMHRKKSHSPSRHRSVSRNRSKGSSRSKSPRSYKQSGIVVPLNKKTDPEYLNDFLNGEFKPQESKRVDTKYDQHVLTINDLLR